MAARRLTLSDLLCDEPNAPSPPVRQPVETPSRSLPSHLASILNDTPAGSTSQAHRDDPSRRPSSPHAQGRDVVPLSLQPVQPRRHTPSPSLRRDIIPGGYAAPPVAPTPIGYDREEYDEGLRLGAPGRSPEYDRSFAGRQQHSLVDSPHQLYPARPHESFSATSYTLARPSSSSRSAYSGSPTIPPFPHSFSYHPQAHSPSASHSPSSVYSLPLPQRQPSHSPALSSRPVTASPVNYFHPPPTQQPPHSSPHTPFDPVRSSLRGPGVVGPSSPTMLSSGSPPSNLLPTSGSRIPSTMYGSPKEAESRPSTASISNILNSPSSSRSNIGLGGLEALVQAATEERRRLSGELGSSALSSRVDSSPRLSRSPVLERASVQPSTSMPAKVYTKPLSPLLVRTSSGSHRNILNDDVAAVSPPTLDVDIEPPRKKRKSLDAPDTHTLPVVIPQFIPPPHDVALPKSEARPLSPPVIPKETLPPIGGALCVTSIPVAPHEPGGSTSDNIAPKASTVDSPRLSVETVDEQILDAVDMGPDRAGERERSRDKEHKTKEKEKKKKREQKTKDKRVSEQKPHSGAVVRHADETANDQDAHEWLLEHYASASPGVQPASAPTSSNKAAVGSSVAAPQARTSRDVKMEGSHGRHQGDEPGVARPSKTTQKARSRTPTPLAMLEEELDDVLPVSNTVASTIEDDLDLDLASPVRASPVVNVPEDNDMDVDNELLSLVDDAPPVQHPPRLKPMPVPKFDAHARTKTSQPDSERGSMPPPASPVKDIGKAYLAKAADSVGTTSAAAGHKKKEVSHKPVPKPKAPPKPKAKAATAATSKSKSKAPKEAIASAPSPTPGLTPSTSATSMKGKKATAGSGAAAAAKRSVSVAGGQSRSRSASVMPVAPGAEGDGKPTGESADVDEEKEQTQDDDKLYCICKTQYDEDRAMIACDRCDEWYHTQCVNMPDLEIDLVDQFICPLCVKNNPQLRLQTTYKKRCFTGLKHPNPSSPGACHRPARGTYSKYCSDECGIQYMQARIHAWRGDKDSLWESVKEVRKREGVVVLVKDVAPSDPETGGDGHVSGSADTILEVVKPSRSKVEREKERLEKLLDKISSRRDELRKELDVVLWREKLIELAAARAEQLDECGWDQRLCFGEEEYAEFGSSVLESYEEGEHSAGDAMHVDGASAEEVEWWCRGQKKCVRHAGWQKLRMTEVDCDKEALDGALLKLTTQEREIRKRIEDVLHPSARTSASETVAPVPGSPLQPLNGKISMNGLSKPKANGDTGKKGKKKKP